MLIETNRACTTFVLEREERFPEENVNVPVGYACDFASVPKILWFWLPPMGYYAHAALLHDYCYDWYHRFPDESSPRKDIDRSFLRQMKRDGVGWRTRWTMYLAVRLFGGIYWNRERH